MRRMKWGVTLIEGYIINIAEVKVEEFEKVQLFLDSAVNLI